MTLKNLSIFSLITICIVFSLLIKSDINSTQGHLYTLSEPELEKMDINFELELQRLNYIIAWDDQNADAYYNRGWVYEQIGDPENAEKDYTTAIDIDNSNEDAYFNRGHLYIRSGEYEKAIQDFSEVITLNPESVDAYNNRGNAFFMLGETDSALFDYDTAIDLNPEDPELYQNRAVIYSAKGDRKKAEQDLLEAVRLEDKFSTDNEAIKPEEKPATMNSPPEGYSM